MENVENIEAKTTFLKPKAFFSIVAQAREWRRLESNTTTKQTTGTTNDRLTAGNTCTLLSIIIACKAGNTLPPKIAIIKPADPNSVSSFIPPKAMP